ncbi:MAG: hypothetical protein HWN68_04895 [Desulfobacterales bacterium]|nr:hypothetical protein [Desulfobacterales bacterium]
MKERRIYEKQTDSKKQGTEERYSLKDFDLKRPEVIKESMQVVPRYGGKLKLLKTSVSLPQSIIDDLRPWPRPDLPL